MQLDERYAGAVLLNPFLPRLFQSLDLLNAQGRFSTMENAWIAQACVYYAVSGETVEHQTDSMLCRYLCGVHESEWPVGPIVLSPQALEATHRMLEAVVANWEYAARMSIDGLRESFLHREGKFACENNDASLRVSKKGIDVLLEMLPWAYQTIHHPWMHGPLKVVW